MDIEPTLNSTDLILSQIFEQYQFNLDLWPREKTILVQSNQYSAIKDHK